MASQEEVDEVVWRTPYDKLMRRPLVKPSTVSHQSATGLGTLNSLPADILVPTLESLDFQSLSRFAQTSAAANNLVQSLPAYEQVMKHAAGPLSVLLKTGLLAQHSAASLYRALLDPGCISCGEFGPFLFLLTAERVCGECLSRKLIFRLGRQGEIERYFGLKEEHHALLPTLRTLPGRYPFEPQRLHIGFECWSRVPQTLVSVKQAMELSLRLGLKWRHPVDPSKLEEPRVSSDFAWHSVPEGRNRTDFPSIFNFKLIPAMRDFWPNVFQGLSHVRFPFVDGEGQADWGRWCQGCEYTRVLFMFDELPREVEEQELKDAFGGCVATKFSAMASHLWSREGFNQHVKHCYGAGLLFNRWRKVHEEMKERGFRPKKQH
ncbi:hypothetical protein NEMBOFW57_009014 [Staphylotrichum longicolle]|uniref:F-box domain-containing protein n=1 Tax=Staphylotrichum longicolle TaxID=669026 RepID=A0AAD4EWP4_9PEZI|nr:hypothetical protein NEMBOFW57_009014 [Staphylotrichum longicolle]